jgi:hypothetical protein
MFRIICSVIWLLLFPQAAFFSVFIKPRPFVYARLWAKPLALTRSLCVFTLGIFPCFLKIFLIFDRVKNNKIFQPAQLRRSGGVFP